MVFIAGAYIDDLDAAFHACLAAVGVDRRRDPRRHLLAAWLVNRDITGSLGGLKTRWIGWRKATLRP